MLKTIEVNGIEVKLKSSAAIPRKYRKEFCRDLFVDMAELEKQIMNGQELSIESLETFENMAYMMHREGDQTQPDNIDDWLDQFELFDIYEIMPIILSMWRKENAQTSSPKKEDGK